MMLSFEPAVSFALSESVSPTLIEVLFADSSSFGAGGSVSCSVAGGVVASAAECESIAASPFIELNTFCAVWGQATQNPPTASESTSTTKNITKTVFFNLLHTPGFLLYIYSLFLIFPI